MDGVAPEERDAQFLERLRRADRDALGRFYELYFDRIYGYVRRMVGEDTLAEDLTQDVFLQLQRSFSSFDPSRELSPWVFTIASNKLRDHWRSRRHGDGLRETSLDEESTDGLPLVREPTDPRGGPLTHLVDSELRELLSAAIDALPSGMREAFVLRWHEDLSFEDIGRIVQRNETAVRKRYSRALEELRAVLEQRARTSLGGNA